MKYSNKLWEPKTMVTVGIREGIRDSNWHQLGLGYITDQAGQRVSLCIHAMIDPGFRCKF